MLSCVLDYYIDYKTSGLTIRLFLFKLPTKKKKNDINIDQKTKKKINEC